VVIGSPNSLLNQLLHAAAVSSRTPTRINRAADSKQLLEEAVLSDDATIAQADGRIMSAFVRARKPDAEKSCCGPTCCSCPILQR
jgi:hypothetical protein